MVSASITGRWCWPHCILMAIGVILVCSMWLMSLSVVSYGWNVYFCPPYRVSVW